MAEQVAGDEMPAGEYQVMDVVDFLRDVLGVGAPAPVKEQRTEARMDEPTIIWRHGHAWRQVEGGHYVADVEAETLGRVRLHRVARCAYRFWYRVDTAGRDLYEVELRDALEAAGFDTKAGTWRTEAQA